MTSKLYQFAAFAALFVSLQLFMNCSDVGFETGSESSSGRTTSDQGNGNVGGVITQPGQGGSGDGSTNPGGGSGSTGGGTVPAPTVPPPTVPSDTTPGSTGLPRVYFVGPPCLRQALCEVQFRMDRAYPFAVDFDWRTDDEFHLKPRLSNEPVHAQVNVHYLSARGHMTFAPGETSKRVYIQNINPYDYEILIQIIMSSCSYGGVSQSCRQIFY